MKLITEYQSPGNIACFRANNYADAIKKASEAITTQEKVQGAVWLQDDGAFEKILPDVHNQSTIAGGLTIQYFSQTKDGFECKIETPHMATPEQIHTLCQRDADSILTLYPQGFTGRLDIYRKSHSNGRHFDNSSTSKKSSSHKLFNGQTMRSVQTFSGLGTSLYDTSQMPEETLRQIWQNSMIEQENALMGMSTNIVPIAKDQLKQEWSIRTGDVIFILNTNWGRSRALYHAPPQWDMAETGIPRIVKVIDFPVANI